MAGQETIICQCMEISREEIIRAIKEKGLVNVEQVQDETEAGTGCGACITFIQEIIEEINT